MATKIMHTATPWCYKQMSGFVGSLPPTFAICQGTKATPESRIVFSGVEKEADAEFIVRACNRDHLFDNLLNELSGALCFMEDAIDDPLYKKTFVQSRLAKVRKLIADAEAASKTD